MQLGLSFNGECPVPLNDTQPLRPYQSEAVAGIRNALEANRSTLIVLPTGAGKTRVFSEVIHEWPGRVLVLAHRDELLQQAKDRIAERTGEAVGLEQAAFFSGGQRVVVGSVQTMSQEHRLERWRPSDFGLLVVDEAHHAPAKSYRKVLDYFAEAKVLGVTATPDRADEKAMGAVFESVAYCYEIEDAIRDHYLVPITVRSVFIDAINLTACRTVAGDLNQGDLDAAMAVEEALHGVVDATLRESGERKTLVFTTSVENSKRIAEIFNRYRAGSARSIDGKTPLDVRRGMLAAYRRHEYQYLVNCSIATEGFDCPEIGCVAMARPTKSRSLFAQMVGRGLRPAADKDDCLVLEFTGNSGKHRLASSVDILGGKYPEDEVEEAKRIVAKSAGMRADEALAAAHDAAEKRRVDEAARRADIRAKVAYRTQEFNPFDVFHMAHDKHDEWDARFGGAVASDSQLATMQKFGLDIPKGCTKQQAHRLIGTCITRINKGLASYKQIRALTKYNVDAVNMTKAHASEVMDSIAKNGWKRPSQDVFDRIIARGREPGEDG